MIESINAITQPSNYKKIQVFKGETGINSSINNMSAQSDTVEVSKQGQIEKSKTKGMSKGIKWALGIGGTIAAIVTAGICIMKHNSNKMLKLCKEKLKLTQLPENIEFKEAATVDEGIKFTKEVLGIKEVDETFTLEAINWVNKGIVDVSNANKGKLFIPTSLKFTAMEDDVLASANHGIKTPDFGEFSVNKKYFDHEFLNQRLNPLLKPQTTREAANGTKKEVAAESKKKITLSLHWTERFKKLAHRYIENTENLTIQEKRELYLMSDETAKKHLGLTEKNPLSFLEHFESVFKDANIQYDYEAISKLPKEEQISKIADLAEAYRTKTEKKLTIATNLKNPYQTIYHEMGHFQDYAENLENLLMKDTEWARFKRSFKNKDTKIKTEDLEAVESRWCKASDLSGNGKTLQNMIQTDPERIKEVLPDLYEHLTNSEVQKTSSKVSDYAKEGVGEFVAEVYAELIHGIKLPEDVMALYKKYNGPLPANRT